MFYAQDWLIAASEDTLHLTEDTLNLPPWTSVQATEVNSERQVTPPMFLQTVDAKSNLYKKDNFERIKKERQRCLQAATVDCDEKMLQDNRDLQPYAALETRVLI